MAPPGPPKTRCITGRPHPKTHRTPAIALGTTQEADDLLAATRTPRLAHADYLALAMAHRWCVVAPGDFVATHKISEAMALGARPLLAPPPKLLAPRALISIVAL